MFERKMRQTVVAGPHAKKLKIYCLKNKRKCRKMINVDIFSLFYLIFKFKDTENRQPGFVIERQF